MHSVSGVFSSISCYQVAVAHCRIAGSVITEVVWSLMQHGQQEDAEEFLSCILNRLHDEMVALMKLPNKGSFSFLFISM